MNFQEFELTSSGGSFLFPGSGTLQPIPVRVHTAATITLAAGFSLGVSGTPISNVPYITFWDARVSLGGFPVTINGVSIPQDQVNQPGIFVSVYNGTSFSVQYMPDFGSRPQDNPGVNVVSVPAGGGTLNVTAGADKQNIVLQASPPVTLSSNYTVALGTVGVTEGAIVRTLIGGGVTLGANTMTVASLSISRYDALNGNAMVFSVFNGTSWNSVYINANPAIEKLSTTGFTSGDNGKIPFYNNSTGLWEKGYIQAINFSGGLIPLYKATIRIPTSEVLTLNGTPKTLIAAPGVGKVIEIIHVSVKIDYGTTPYATNTSLRVRHVGAGFAIRFQNDILLSTASRTLRMDGIVSTGSGTTNTQILENAALQAFVDVGNPTAGDSDIYVNIWYTITDY